MMTVTPKAICTLWSGKTVYDSKVSLHTAADIKPKRGLCRLF